MRIKKLLLGSLLMIACLLTLSGCLERVEINKMGIVAGLAIDKNEDHYVVTAQILNPAAISGKSGNSLPVYSLKAEGRSIHEAYKKLDQLTSTALSLSHLNVMVINEEFAEAGFAPLLNFSLRRTDIRPDISFVVAKEASASEILSVVTALDMIPAAQLDVLSKVPSYTQRLSSYNLYEVVDMVNGNSINVVLNAVSIHREEAHLNEETQGEDGEKGKTEKNGSTVDNIHDITVPVQLRFEHLAVFQNDKLVGFIDDYEAQLYNIVTGVHKRYDMVTQIEEEYYTSVGFTEVKTKLTTDLAQNEATIKINLGAIIIENTYPIDFTNTENLKVMSEHLKEHFETDMNDFIEKVQTELKSDIFGIGGKAYYHENKLWKEKEGYWSDIFPELTIHLEVEVEINSVGEIGNVTL